MNVGIIGSGEKNMALAELWLSRGHSIKMATNQNANGSNLKGVEFDTINEVIKFGEVNLFCVPHDYYSIAIDEIRSAEGKIFIDACVPTGEIISNNSLAEILSGFVPKAQIVKAYCYLNPEVIIKQKDVKKRPYLFYCGDDDLSKSVVERLIIDSGFEPIDIGKLTKARHLEQLALLNSELDQVMKGRPFLITLNTLD